MNRLAVVLLVIITSCNVDKKDKLESFIWIEHNRNWIRNDSSRFMAIRIINYNDNAKSIAYAKLKNINGSHDFFYAYVSDTLHDMIYRYLYGKQYSEYYRQHRTNNNPGYLYDGNVYCIIYKFSNQPEKIINFIPPEVPDSLMTLTEYLENLPNRKIFQEGIPYNVSEIVNKHRQSMFMYFERLPEPPDTILDRQKYTPQIIVDTLK